MEKEKKEQEETEELDLREQILIESPEGWKVCLTSCTYPVDRLIEFCHWIQQNILKKESENKKNYLG